jgi:hypothetical protein
MFEGKLGEKGFKQWLDENNFQYNEWLEYEGADEYDFLVYTPQERRLDVKTRTQLFHRRTVEMVEQMKMRPKDIFVSCKLNKGLNGFTVDLLGWATRDDFVNKGTIENLGYLDNHVLYDRQLRDMNELAKILVRKE